MVGGVIYDKDKTTFRSEIDQALRAKPDMIYMNGYTPDVTVVMKELFKAGYTGGKVAQGYAVNTKLLASLPHEVTDGTYTVQPSPSVGSDAYKRLASSSASERSPSHVSATTHQPVGCHRGAKARQRTTGAHRAESSQARAPRSTAASRADARPRQEVNSRAPAAVRLHRDRDILDCRSAFDPRQGASSLCEADLTCSARRAARSQRHGGRHRARGPAHGFTRDLRGLRSPTHRRLPDTIGASPATWSTPFGWSPACPSLAFLWPARRW